VARGTRQQERFYCIRRITYWCITIHDPVIHLWKAFTSLDPQKSIDASMDLTFRTRNVLTFVNTTAIAYRQKFSFFALILASCNSSCVHKRQDITSIRDFAVDTSRVFLPSLACICQAFYHPDLDLTLGQEQIQRI
jgi:hypothetical protein